MMLAVCKQQRYDLDSYLDPNHPLQKAIYEKHVELCECKKSDIVLSYDGCNAPIYAMPLKNIALGYLNLFLDKKYEFLKDAYLKCPDIMGGEKRTDSVIIKKGEGKLIAKVGAGGFLAILNLESKEVLLIKMTTEDYKAREFSAQAMLLKLGWIKEKFADTSIKTSSGIYLGEWEFTR
jgi:L-asparaginase